MQYQPYAKLRRARPLDSIELPGLKRVMAAFGKPHRSDNVWSFRELETDAVFGLQYWGGGWRILGDADSDPSKFRTWVEAQIDPKPGMGATCYVGFDCVAATVVRVRGAGREVTVQPDKVRSRDGLSCLYIPDQESKPMTFLRRDGIYRQRHRTSVMLSIGFRYHYRREE